MHATHGGRAPPLPADRERLLAFDSRRLLDSLVTGDSNNLSSWDLSEGNLHFCLAE